MHSFDFPSESKRLDTEIQLGNMSTQLTHSSTQFNIMTEDVNIVKTQYITTEQYVNIVDIG